METKSQNPTQQTIVQVLGYIFSRPILAAALIGMFIHLGKWVNYTIHGEDYFQSIAALADHGLVFAIADVLLSFIVPALVVCLSAHLAKLREEKFFASFPDLNPDLVIKCASDGTPDFVNSSVKLLMRDLQIASNDIATLIPEEVTSCSINSNKIPQQIVHHTKGISIEYNVVVTDDGLVFLSGRQI